MTLAAAAVVIATRRAPLEHPRRLSDLKQHQLTFDGQAIGVGLSPDGRTLAYISRNQLRLLDIDEHREPKVPAPKCADVQRLPDSSAVALAMRDGSGTYLPRADWPTVPAHVFTTSKGILIESQPLSLGRTDLMFVPVADGAPAGEIHSLVEGLDAEWFIFSRDGRKAAYTRSRGPTQLWRVTIDRPESPHPDVRARRLLEDTAEKRAPVISFDGKSVAYIARAGNSMDVFIVPIDGGLLEDRGQVRDPVWSQDGNLVVVDWDGGYGTALYGVSAAERRVERLLAEGRHGELLAWSADGEWFYVRGTSMLSKTIFRIPSFGGVVEPWFTLPIDGDVAECAMSRDVREIVCVAGGEADVWMIDDFDQLLPH